MQRIEDFIGPERGVGAVNQLPLRQMVTDYCDKYIALDRAGEPAAFVVLSPPTHPGSVRDASIAAEAARKALGNPLGDSVLTPHFVGEIEGCSYSITRYCRPMSAHRLVGRWQQWRMKPAMLAWLARATGQTAAPSVDLDQTVREPLRTLAGHVAVSSQTRDAAATALRELDGGAWAPRSVLAHNDLWWGNFVHRPTAPRGEAPFYVIDWAGSNCKGMPFYDLVRISRSLNLSANEFRRQADESLRILECKPPQMLHYLSAALGTLARSLGEWPEAAFARTADECIRFASASLK